MNIIETIRNTDLLYAAWFPQTKQYYLLRDSGGLCAVLFAGREDFEHYAEQCKAEDIRIEAVENKTEDREILYADLWRCGVRQLYLAGQAAAHVSLSELFTPPDYSTMSAAERLVPDSDMTGLILWVMQNTALGTVDAAMEREMLTKLKQACFLGPVVIEEDGSVSIPIVAPDGKQLVLLFTDRREYAAVFKDRKLTLKSFDFEEMLWLVCNGFDAVVINYANGAPLMLDRELLEAAQNL